MDLADAVIGIRAAAGAAGPAALDAGADVDGDGAVGLAEALMALRRSALPPVPDLPLFR